MPNYEMVLVLDPRLSDEEVEGLSTEYKDLLAGYSAEVTKEESWGKRKLAYPIRKLNEGKYLIYQIETGEQSPFVEVEHRLGQNEKVLRYLTVRTDEGRLRVRGESGRASGGDDVASEEEGS